MNAHKRIQLKPDEQVLAALHEAGVAYVPWFALFFVWIVAPFFFLFPLFRQGPLGVTIFFALTLSGLLVALRKFFIWKHSVLLVTDLRVVDVEQRGFFDRTYSEVAYADVQDVTFRVKGIFPTVFRYGTLTIKTAGNAADIEMRRVRHPAKYHDLLHDVRKEAVVAVPKNLRARKVKELVERMSDEEVDRLVLNVREKERDEATKELYKKPS